LPERGAVASSTVNNYLPMALFVSAALAVWVAMLVQRRPSVRGGSPFLWLIAAVGWWCVSGAVHALVGGVELKILWAKLQYIGVASVPPLWLLFAAAYAEAGWVQRPARVAWLWIVPAATVIVAATNEWHLAMWPGVTLEASGATIYDHGWWFWIAAATNYGYVVAGAMFIVRALRKSPPPYRTQHAALIAASLLPLASNLVYLTGFSIPGFDPTPHAFALSGLLFTWALLRHRLFDLVPVARDMVVDSLTDAVVVLDPSQRVLDMNASARELAGRPETWLGKPVDEVLPFLKKAPLELRTGFASTITIGDGDGRSHYDLHLAPVRTRSHTPEAWALLVRDITAQRRAAEERDALSARIAEQQQRESLSVLAGGLAHDFNNLLAGIVGNADLLSLKVAPSSEMGNNVGAILLGAQRAADLVDKMLAYAGERHGSTSRVDLDHLVRDLLDLLQASAARHCTLHYEGTPAFVDVDATQIRQVAMNLIINAAEAVEEATGVVRVRIGIERLSARQLTEMDSPPEARPGTYAYLEVRDNGPGMSADTMQKIFNPFFTTKATGHGLGLAAVQGIVRGHRGVLRVDSTPGYGAKFCCWFPLADTTKQEPSIASGQSELSHGSALREGAAVQ
jgi:signal transduction histidine kinase